MKFIVVASSLLLLGFTTSAALVDQHLSERSALLRRSPYVFHSITPRDDAKEDMTLFRRSPMRPSSGGQSTTRSNSPQQRREDSPDPHIARYPSSPHPTGLVGQSATGNGQADRAWQVADRNLRAAAAEAVRNARPSRPSTPIREGIRRAFSDELDMRHIEGHSAGHHPLMNPAHLQTPERGEILGSALRPPQGPGSGTTSPSGSRTSPNRNGAGHQ